MWERARGRRLREASLSLLGEGCVWREVIRTGLVWVRTIRFRRRGWVAAPCGRGWMGLGDGMDGCVYGMDGCGRCDGGGGNLEWVCMIGMCCFYVRWLAFYVRFVFGGKSFAGHFLILLANHIFIDQLWDCSNSVSHLGIASLIKRKAFGFAFWHCYIISFVRGTALLLEEYPIHFHSFIDEYVITHIHGLSRFIALYRSNSLASSIHSCRAGVSLFPLPTYHPSTSPTVYISWVKCRQARLSSNSIICEINKLSSSLALKIFLSFFSKHYIT